MSNNSIPTIPEDEKDLNIIDLPQKDPLNPKDEKPLKIEFVPGILEDAPIEKRLDIIKDLKTQIVKITPKKISRLSKLDEILNDTQLKQSVNLAKSFLEENHEKIQKDINNMVALYNIGDKKAFYFITPSEARLAIEYISELRTNNKTSLKSQYDRDNNIENFIEKNIVNSLPVNDENEIARVIEYKRNSKYPQPYFCQINKNIFPELNIEQLNQTFSFVEKFDLTVQGILANSSLHATIRSWGKNVCDELNSKEIVKRFRKKAFVMSHIWTADVYVCNSLKDNQIILYNDLNVFFNVNLGR